MGKAYFLKLSSYTGVCINKKKLKLFFSIKMITIFKYKSFPYINNDEPSHIYHLSGIAYHQYLNQK